MLIFFRSKGQELSLFSQQLTLKALSKFVAANILKFFLLFFRENKTWHFMWIICLADDSHEMSSYFLWNIKHFTVSSAVLVISALRVYSFNKTNSLVLLKDPLFPHNGVPGTLILKLWGKTLAGHTDLIVGFVMRWLEYQYFLAEKKAYLEL